MKRHYSDYIQHAIRLYYTVREGEQEALPRAEKDNLYAVHLTVKDLSPERAALLQQLILTDEPLPRSVHRLAAQKGTTDAKMWGFLAWVEKTVAEHRGLV